jgi:hypothetical protein
MVSVAPSVLVQVMMAKTRSYPRNKLQATIICQISTRPASLRNLLVYRLSPLPRIQCPPAESLLSAFRRLQKRPQVLKVTLILHHINSTRLPNLLHTPISHSGTLVEQLVRSRADRRHLSGLLYLRWTPV